MATRRTKTVKDIPISSELEAVIKQIRKAHGNQAVVRGSAIRQPFRIRTGIFTLDYALIGGIPFNRTTMVHGKKHGGKSTITNKVIASVQRSLPHQQAVLVDVEGTFDDTWAKKCKVDTDLLHVVQPDTGEAAVDMAVALVHAKETSLVAVDSLAALLPMKEEEGSAEDSDTPGLMAKLITKMLRRITGAQIQERKRGHFVSFLVLNQHRVKIGGWSPSGEPRSLPGGTALGHFTSCEILVKNKENVDKTTGLLTVNEHTFTIEKNKMNAGMRTGEWQMLRQDDEELGLVEGDIDDAGTMLTFAKKYGWYDGTPKGGYTLEFGDIAMKFNNGDEAAAALYADPEVFESLYLQLIVQNALAQKMPEDFISYLLS